MKLRIKATQESNFSLGIKDQESVSALLKAEFKSLGWGIATCSEEKFLIHHPDYEIAVHYLLARPDYLGLTQATFLVETPVEGFKCAELKGLFSGANSPLNGFYNRLVRLNDGPRYFNKSVWEIQTVIDHSAEILTIFKKINDFKLSEME